MPNKYVERFKKALGYGEEKKSMEQSLERLGINVLLDRKLEQKLEALQTLYDMLEEEIETKDPLEYLNILNTRLKMLNRAIHSLSAPSYKASTYGAFKDLLDGWVMWNSVAEYCIEAVRDRIMNLMEPKPKEKQKANGDNTHEPSDAQIIHDEVMETMRKILQVTAIDVWTLVRRLHSVLQLHVFQDAQLVLALSYLREDVAPAHATIVKTIGERGGFDLSKLKEEKI